MKHITLAMLLALALTIPACGRKPGDSNGGATPTPPENTATVKETRPSATTIRSAFAGKINRALTMTKSQQVYVVSTHEDNKATQQSIQEYARRVRDRFAPLATLVTDEEALKMSLSNHTVVVYGTLTGNRWLAVNLAAHPVKIGNDKIEAGARFLGAHLRFITTWPNPWDSTQALVVYTAQRAEDIPGINGVSHGPTDYVVAQGTNMLQAADYEKHNGTWTFPTAAGLSQGAAKSDAADRLKRLKSLFEQGLISKEDYDKKVKEIVDAL